MKSRTVVDDCFGILGNLTVQDIIGFITGSQYGILRTDTDTAPAAHTFIMIDRSFFVSNDSCAVSTDFGTCTTSDTEILVNMRLSGTVHFHLSGAGSTSHTDIFQGTAKSGCFVPFKMGECQENIGIHDGTSDLGFFDIFTAFNRNEHIIGSFQAVTDQNMTSGGIWSESVQIGTLDMIQCILAAAYIEGITVCQIRFSTQFFYKIYNSSCIIRA